jgi:hypothetical protein
MAQVFEDKLRTESSTSPKTKSDAIVENENSESQPPTLQRTESKTKELAHAFEEQQRISRSGSSQSPKVLDMNKSGHAKELAEAFENNKTSKADKSVSPKAIDEQNPTRTERCNMKARVMAQAFVEQQRQSRSGSSSQKSSVPVQSGMTKELAEAFEEDKTISTDQPITRAKSASPSAKIQEIAASFQSNRPSNTKESVSFFISGHRAECFLHY